MLSNTPAYAAFRARAARPFAFGVTILKQDKSPLNLTGSTIRLRVGSLEFSPFSSTPATGQAVFLVQADEMPPKGRSTALIWLKTAEGFVTDLVEIELTVEANPNGGAVPADSGVVVPAESLTISLLKQNQVTVKVNHHPDSVLLAMTNQAIASASAAAGSAAVAQGAAASTAGSVTQAQAAASAAVAAQAQAVTYATVAYGWADQAGQSAGTVENAKVAAVNAATAAAAAKTASEAAQGKAETAKGLAEAARTTAVNSATAAGTSATNADTRATNAETSRAAAAAARVQAETAATNAETARGLASSAKDAALLAANAASGSATTAADAAAAAAAAAVPSGGTAGQVLTRIGASGYGWVNATGGGGGSFNLGDHDLAEIRDVYTTGAFPDPGQVLTFDGEAWTNVDPAAAAAAWGDITGKPALFPPAAHNHDGVYSLVSHDHAGNYAPVLHTHTQAQVTGLSTALGAKLNALNAVVNLTDPTTMAFADVNITDDGSATAGWPERFRFLFNGKLTSRFNEYGEFRGSSGKTNTVAMRLFTKETDAEANHDAASPIFEVVLSRQTRTNRFKILPDGSTVQSGVATQEITGGPTLSTGYIVLAGAAAVPAGTPAGTLIIRT